MAIQFVVEDGTGKTDATSYISVEDFEQYWEDRGTDYATTKDEAMKQAKLNVATQYVDNLHIYEGVKQTTTQALEFPRQDLIDRNMTDRSGTVPDAVAYAVCEAAAYELEGNALEEATQLIESKSMGPVSVRYGSGGKLPPKLGKVEKYLGQFVAAMRVGR